VATETARAPEPAVAPVAEAAAPRRDTSIVVFPGLVLESDSVAWNRYPRVMINECIGEACSMRFQAIACRDVVLRSAPFDTAALGDTIRRNDTITVLQTDLHMESPGIVVFRKAFDLDYVNGDEGAYPADDTLRFAVTDTLYLLRYRGMGFWQGALRGRKVLLSDGWWFASDSIEGGFLGSASSDSSAAAVARSYPVVSDWWHVALEGGRRGFWRNDVDWREGLKPEGKYWESTRCPDQPTVSPPR
jgi:hypothetical protein